MAIANYDKLIFSIQLRFPILIVGLGLTVLAAVTYGLSAGSTFDLKVLLQIIAAGIALTSLLYVAINLHTLNDTQQRNLAREKQKNAIELIASWEDKVKATTVANQLRKEVVGKSPEQIREILKGEGNDPDFSYEQSLVTVLNFFERLSLSIKDDFADEEMLKQFFRGPAMDYYHAFKEYIASVRVARKNERIFEHFFALAKKWE